MKPNVTVTALLAGFTLTACQGGEPPPPDAVTYEPDSISCDAVCSVAVSGACAPFSWVGSVFCGFASLDLCGTVCTKFHAGQMHCLTHGESKACMADVKGDDGDTTNDYVSWCDHTKDSHHTYVQYEFRKGYTPPGVTEEPYPHINQTADAPEGHCQTIELNPLLESPPAVYRWQVCTSGEGCSAWRYPAGT